MTKQLTYRCKRRRHRAHIWRRDGGRCAYCRRRVTRDEMTLDHVKPRALGGTDDKWNVVVSCGTCNHLKGCRSLEEFAPNLYGRIRTRLHRMYGRQGMDPGALR